jgi:hypothetical protein
MNDGSLWQNLILKGMGFPSVQVPGRGTVTASAIDLAFLLSRSNIFITGMDLASRDIRTHARPYGFDHLLRGASFRLNPFYSQSFIRSRLIDSGGSQRIYAAWFKEQLKNWPERIFSLGKNNPVFEPLKNSDAVNTALTTQERTGKILLGSQTGLVNQTSLNNQTVPESQFSFIPSPQPQISPAASAKKALEILEQTLTDSPLAGSLAAELSPLLFAGEKQLNASDIRTGLRELIFSGARYG